MFFPELVMPHVHIDDTGFLTLSMALSLFGLFAPVVAIGRNPLCPVDLFRDVMPWLWSVSQERAGRPQHTKKQTT
jgi:hypothetical protein